MLLDCTRYEHKSNCVYVCVCVCVCVHVCVRARARARVSVCVCVCSKCTHLNNVHDCLKQVLDNSLLTPPEKTTMNMTFIQRCYRTLQSQMLT